MAENNRKRPRWEDEDWEVETPDASKIVCKKCFLREKDRPLEGGGKIEGCTLGMCQVFPVKPHDILFKGESCPYFIDEDEE